MMSDEASTTAAGRPLGAISTLVSLFLLLLVFFIVLFSISQVHQQRLDTVLTSIDDAFGRLPSGLGLITRPAPSDEEATPEGFVRAVGTLLSRFSPLTESGRLAPGGTLLEIALAPKQMFKGDGNTLQPQAAAILDRLAVLLQRRLPGQHFRLTLRAVTPAGADTGLAGERLASFAAMLFAKGCPPDALAVGLEPGAAEAMRLDFSLVGAPPAEAE
jgi:hypothetical protein